jgi:5-methylcytosine-specific restriction enzyme B
MIENIRDFIKKEAERFGAKSNVEFNKPFVERNNTGADALNDNGAYFGFIHPDEDAAGPFHDFSISIFPNNNGKAWLVCLGIGSSGFKNDYELATYPGLRRLFSKLIDDKGFCKSDFSDIETGLPKSLVNLPELQHIKNTIKTYTKVLPVVQIVDNPESEKGQNIISAFIAAYAKLREWPTNNEQRNSVSQALAAYLKSNNISDENEVSNLLMQRKYIVLQGPPGTGKTRLAKNIANLDAKTFFTQFHAETSYSDFIYGIRPSTDDTNLSYSGFPGIFAQAVSFALQNPDQKTILIIDEINRANLSNVLGPLFYLFEHKQDISNVELEITPKLKISEIPENLLVIATMNTADRSLAVVDFALRRRFAWYTLKPRAISSQCFYKDDFDKFQEIFDWYASSSEMALQPGQGYFIASTEEEMLNRVRYELYPLVKEYIQEGLLGSAKEEFNNYFMARIGSPLFE